MFALVMAGRAYRVGPSGPGVTWRTAAKIWPSAAAAARRRHGLADHTAGSAIPAYTSTASSRMLCVPRISSVALTSRVALPAVRP
jgi:hypothetical protein